MLNNKNHQLLEDTYSDMEDPKALAQKMVDLTKYQAEMLVYKHLNDYMKKYAQNLYSRL